MISDQYKCIFVHVPKCAGTSIDNALLHKKFRAWNSKLNIWEQHATISQIKKHFISPEKFKEYFKFSIVRNPWSRVVSNYMATTNWEHLPVSKDTFRDFIFSDGIFKELMDPKKINMPRNIYHRSIPAYDYLFENGKLMMDFVGRFENLKEDWKKICNKLRIKLELPHELKQKYKPYKEFYDNETKEEVARFYKKDIDFFNYEF